MSARPGIAANWLAIALLAILLTFCSVASCSPQLADTKIIGGHPATLNATAHQVSLRMRAGELSGPGRGMRCGGSLITLRAVLTAAHCLFEELPESTQLYPRYRQLRADELLVVMGQLLLTQSPANESRRVATVRPHPNYKNALSFDLGVLLLTSAMPAGLAHIRPIALQRQPVADNTVCQVTGWGTTKYQNNALNNALLTVDVPIVDTSRCNSSYQGLLDAAMICAGDWDNGGRDACQGDSGGPFVCGGQLTGVVSFGVECGTAKYPGIYVNVSYYRDWIERNGAADLAAKAGSWAMLLLVAVVVAIASARGGQ